VILYCTNGWTFAQPIEIPSDFSAKFLTVLTDKPQKPQIVYKVDTKANPMAGKITSTASNTLIQQGQNGVRVHRKRNDFRFRKQGRQKRR
jgi:hypothetical protein